MRCDERDAPGVEADQHDVVGAVVALDDLVRDPGQRPPEVGGVEDVGAEDRGIERGVGSGVGSVNGPGDAGPRLSRASRSPAC